MASRSSSFTSAHQRGGALIEWQDVNFTVLDRTTGQQKRIITGMTGMAQPGRLLSIMGPSGAGKSTLLDVLACTSSSAGSSMEGRILVDGAPRDVRHFRRISCYVQQKDVLLSSATVREVVMTSALLKLPRGVPVAQKRALVDATIKELDLTSCANTLIGDETIGLKGVSGGQKRRVSVGVELVKDPGVLFLDEPSSGLDSEMALSVMTTLLRLARKGRTVVCTIHQPNSDITDCFDDFLLLAGGRAMYGGLWSGAVDFFAKSGYSCPAFKNPTDYFLSVITRDEAAVDTLATAYDKARGALLAQMAGESQAAVLELQQQQQQQYSGSQSNGYQHMRQGKACGDADDGGPTVDGGPRRQQRDHLTLEMGEAPAGPPADPLAVAAASGGRQLAAAATATSRLGSTRSKREAEHDAAEERVPWWFQVGVLSVRYWRTWIRNPVMMSSELVQYVFTAVFIGLMFCRFNDTIGEGDYNRASCIWFSLAVLSFTPSYTAVTNWTSERLLLRRELSQRLYGITSYYLARYSVLVPFQLAQCLLFLLVMYFFVGFQASVGGFFTFFAVFSMFQIISEGVGACCAVATRTATGAIILLTFVLLVLLAFSGFLTAKVPVYFKWVQKSSYLTYAYSALLEREFSHITFVDPTTGEVVPGMQVFPAVLKTGLSFSDNMGILAGQVAGMEGLKLTAFNLAYRLGLM